MKGKKPQPADFSIYENIINQNFKFIEKQCYRAVQLKPNALATPHPITIENEALELSGRVLDLLTRNHFQVLREFRNESKLSTYLVSIIAKQAVDMIRKKRGRSREKERAKKYGDLGKQIIQKIFVQGLSTREAYHDLVILHQLKKSENEFESIVESIRGGKPRPGDRNGFSPGPVIKKGDQDSETGEITLSDKENVPEKFVMKQIQDQEIEKILNQVISQLDGEERLILRMRYPFGNDELPKDIPTISRLLGVSPKAVYRRISRILKKCRSEFEKKGISLNDLL